jgi:hypothetical protein
MMWDSAELRKPSKQVRSQKRPPLFLLLLVSFSLLFAACCLTYLGEELFLQVSSR